MTFLLTVLLLLAIVILLIMGLLSPNAGLFWYKGRRTRLKAFGIYSSAILLFFCIARLTQHECEPNTSLDKYNKRSAEYKAEFIRQLRQLPAGTEFDYYVADYREKDGHQFLDVSMHSKQFCALTEMEITGVGRLAQLIESKGMSYHGAGLEGLKYRIDSTDGNYSFCVTSVKDILD